jgi:hypothetical protein
MPIKDANQLQNEITKSHNTTPLKNQHPQGYISIIKIKKTKQTKLKPLQTKYKHYLPRKQKRTKTQTHNKLTRQHHTKAKKRLQKSPKA